MSLTSQKEVNVKRLLDKARLINPFKFPDNQQQVCFSSAIAQLDGQTLSTWIPTSSGSKKHSVSWLTKGD